MAKPVYEAIRELGLFKLWLPRSLGGEEVDFRTVVEVVEGLAYMDGSAAWNLVIALQSSWLLAFVGLGVAAEAIERCWRDVHMVTQHAGAAPSNYVRAGAYRLGLGFGTGR